MPAKITVSKNGPLRVEGDFELLDSEGKPYGLGGRTAISLCRCGFSANKPFCDGSHARQGFVSQVAALEMPPANQSHRRRCFGARTRATTGAGSGFAGYGVMVGEAALTGADMLEGWPRRVEWKSR